LTEFFHYTKDPDLAIDVNREYKTRRIKPSGFWVSVGDAWKEWCEEEEFHPERLEHVYGVDIDMSGFLTVNDRETITALYEEFPDAGNDSPKVSIGTFVDWGAAASRYAGLLFSPYDKWLNDWRDLPIWWYGLDCASAVVFDLTAIKSLEKRETS
jgi:hypothetical protein